MTKLLTVKQAAERASISKSLIYELCANGSLAHVRIGRPGKRGCIRIAEEDLDAFLVRQKVEERDPPRVGVVVEPRKFKHVKLP